MAILSQESAESTTHQGPSQKVWRVGTLTYTFTGLVVLFCWLLWGDFAWSLKDRTVGPVLGVLFHEFHVSDLLTAFFFTTLPAGIGMVLSPIIAFVSDRHRGRWGRRIPFLLIPTPFTVLGMLGLAYSPVIGTHLHALMGPNAPSENALIIISFGVFWGLFDIATTVAGTVYNALINDVVPQEVMGRFYGMFRALNLIAGALFNFFIFGKADEDYIWIFIGMGVLYGAGFTLMCLKVKEGEPPPAPPMDKGRDIHGFFRATVVYFQECFGLSYYRWYFAFNAVSAVITAPVGLFTLYFSKSPEINLSTDALGKCFTASFIVSLCISYPLGMLADRFHPIRTSMVALVLYALGNLWGGFFVHDQSTFIIALLLNSVLSGIYFTTSISIGQRLLPRAEFAQLSSASGIIIALTGMVLGPAVGYFLDHTHHNYRYTYLISAGLAIAALIGLAIVHKKFVEFGGPDNYRAPEPSGPRRNPLPV